MKRNIIIFSLICFVIFPSLAFCDNKEKGGTENITYASIINLISTPDKYNGKRVSFIGFADFRYEGTAVYLSEEDDRYGNLKNGIWLSINKSKNIKMEKDINEYHRKWVVVIGVFNMNVKGSWGAYSGSLEKIESISYALDVYKFEEINRKKQ